MKILGFGKQVHAWTPNLLDSQYLKIGFALRGGDICDPLNGKWFDPPYPTRVIRKYFPLPILPFLSVRVGNYGFYFGFKMYYAEDSRYLNWMNTVDVYQGSQALCFSLRTTQSGGQ